MSRAINTIAALLALSTLPAASHAEVTVALQGSTLSIESDADGDAVIVKPDGSGTLLKVKVNGTVQASVDLDAVELVEFEGNGGDDSFAAGRLSIPVIASGGSGDDTLGGSKVDDLLDGGDGADSIRGRAGDDLIFGGFGEDVIEGNGGDDRICDGALADDDGTLAEMCAEDGAVDAIYGMAGSDELLGGDEDTLDGGAGDNDLLTWSEWHQASMFPSVTGEAVFFEAGDVTGDGRPDIVTSGAAGVSVWRNIGGKFVQEVVYAEAATSGLAIADLDADGDADLAVAGASPGEDLYVFENTGGGWRVRAMGGGVDFGAEVQAADLDGDGDLDVLAVDGENASIEVFENAGGLSFSHHGSLTAGVAMLSVATGDLDDDGAQEIIFAAEEGTDDFALRRADMAALGFEESTLRSYTVEIGPVATYDHTAGGSVDIVLGVVQGGVRRLYSSLNFNDGEAWFSTLELELPSDAPASLVVADIDGDGEGDWVVEQEGEISWYEPRENLGATVFAGSDTEGLRVADMNDDGVLDGLGDSSGGSAAGQIEWYGLVVE